MAAVAKREIARKQRKVCPVCDELCMDPVEHVFRNERMVFLETLLDTTLLSRADRGFLLAYFDYGPGGSGLMSQDDFGVMFGIRRGMVALRLQSLLDQLKRRTRLLGYRRIDFW